MPEYDTVIVGGGLSGLSCARRLYEAGVSCVVLEKQPVVGGRVQTDVVNGFLLDRGFQVFLTSYPEARRQLDYDRLQLCKFEPGALIRYQGRFRRFSDPWRRPGHLLGTVAAPVASLADKIRMVLLRNDVCRKSIDQLQQRPEVSTAMALRLRGFSPRVIEAFFRPFLGGIFLDNSLETSSRMFEFVFRMFSLGAAALPAQGMGSIAAQMAAALPDAMVQCGVCVETVKSDHIVCDNGRVITARNVVMAVDEASVAGLVCSQPVNGWRGTTCVYYAASAPPVEEPTLVINGESDGLVNNLCVPSQVSDTYAPEGKSLISVTVLGIPAAEDAILDQQIRSQLVGWFGKQVQEWEPLRTYRIPAALPFQKAGSLTPVEKSVVNEQGLFCCGDYLDTASIQGALASGQRAGQAVLDRLGH